MGYLEGFAVTFNKLFEERVTGEYKAKGAGEKRDKPARFHGRHVLNRYEDGMEKCIGCELCAGVCPASCIYVRGADNEPENPVSPGERYGYVYEINYLRCIHCDLCVEACPTQAITESKLFEFSFTSREDAIYTKDELVVGDNGMPQKMPWEDWREGDDKLTSGWMRATSPGGSAAYQNTVAWSGELGYGVRPAEVGQAVVAEAVEVEAVDHGHDGHDDHGHGHDDHGHDDHGHDDHDEVSADDHDDPGAVAEAGEQE